MQLLQPHTAAAPAPPWQGWGQSQALGCAGGKWHQHEQSRGFSELYSVPCCGQEVPVGLWLRHHLDLAPAEHWTKIGGQAGKHGLLVQNNSPRPPGAHPGVSSSRERGQTGALTAGGHAHTSSSLSMIIAKALKMALVGPARVMIRSGQFPSEMLMRAPLCGEAKATSVLAARHGGSSGFLRIPRCCCRRWGQSPPSSSSLSSLPRLGQPSSPPRLPAAPAHSSRHSPRRRCRRAACGAPAGPPSPSRHRQPAPHSPPLASSSPTPLSVRDERRERGVSEAVGRWGGRGDKGRRGKGRVGGEFVPHLPSQ